MSSCFSKTSPESSAQTFISVILPVYNGAPYLNEAIDSILEQTYANFELIIINDGSTDNSAAIIAAYADPRIRFYSQENQGLASTLNKGISLAKGAYIARQDQDDISLPDRFAKQVAFLDANPDYGMVGTWASIWEGTKKTDRAHKHPANDLELKFELLFNNPFVHSSMMIRKTVLDEVGGYCKDQNPQIPEDYELWSRIARKFRIANIPEILHIYREVPQSMCRSGDNPYLHYLLKINAENLLWATGGSYSEQSLHDVAALIHVEYHQFSRKPSLRELTSIIHKASHFLSNNAGDHHDMIHGIIKDRINNLGYHYYKAKYIKSPATYRTNLILRVLRRCVQLIRRQRT